LTSSADEALAATRSEPCSTLSSGTRFDSFLALQNA